MPSKPPKAAVSEETKPTAPTHTRQALLSNKSKHHTQRPVPLSLRSYKPNSPFFTLRRCTLADAGAYYTTRFPDADRFDVITASTTPGNLVSTNWRAALIVYPDPRQRDWQMIYKSNRCPTVEDVAFELIHWVEEDMWDVLDRMKESDRKGEAGKKSGSKSRDNSTSGKDMKDAKGKEKRLDNMDSQKGVGGKNLPSSKEKTKDKEQSKKRVTAQTNDLTTQTEPQTSGLKRKAHTENDNDKRNKNVNISADQRVFAGNSKLAKLKGGKDKEHDSVPEPGHTALPIEERKERKQGIEDSSNERILVSDTDLTALMGEDDAAAYASHFAADLVESTVSRSGCHKRPLIVNGVSVRLVGSK